MYYKIPSDVAISNPLSDHGLDTVLIQRLYSEETKALKKPIRVSRVTNAAPLASKYMQDATCHREKKDGKRGKAGNIMPVLAKTF